MDVEVFVFIFFLYFFVHGVFGSGVDNFVVYNVIGSIRGGLVLVYDFVIVYVDSVKRGFVVYLLFF